jgi:tetratricopeptide (TPR) repeat protein
MRSRTPTPSVTRFAIVLLLGLRPSTVAQVSSGRLQLPNEVQQSVSSHPEAAAAAQDGEEDQRAEEELQKGTALTRKGDFTAAIPHLLASRGKVSNPYAASFNLAICYLGIHEFTRAIHVLNDLQHAGHEGADVENLLAQAYIGNGDRSDALAALEDAALVTPKDEKLYLFVTDACADRQDFELGLSIVNIGLHNLPNSARLHYERGILLSELDQLDQAKADFARASALGKGSEIGYVSGARQALLDGNIPEALRFAREGVHQGLQGPALLTTLGEALLRSGAAAGEPELGEAKTALEKAVEQRPNDPAAEIALGQVCVIAGNLEEAIVHLQSARQIMPNQPSIYAALAKAYQRKGDVEKAQQALATLEKLNLARAEQIRSAPGDRKTSYGGATAGGGVPPNP